MLIPVILHGHLADAFGVEHHYDVETAGEAVRALACMHGGPFLRALQTGAYRVVSGGTDGHGLGEVELGLCLPPAPLHIIPAPAGAGGKDGVGKLILGAALVAVAVAGAFATGGSSVGLLGALKAPAFTILGGSVSWGNIATMGLMIGLAGASQLLSPQTTTAATNESYIFNGAQNSVEEGGPVPILFGRRFRTGGVIVSCAITAQEIALDD